MAGDFYDSGEPIAAFAWPLLTQVGGLARLAGVRLELTPRGRATLIRPSYEALGSLWARWLGSVSTDELARIEAIKGQRKPGTLTSAVTRRAAVAAALAALPPGAWTGAGKVLAGLRAAAAAAGRRAEPAGAVAAVRGRLLLRIARPRRLADLGPGRGQVRALRAVRVRRDLGLIDVAYTDPRGARDDYRALWGADQLSCLSRYDGLAAVRVNELGAAVLHDPRACPASTCPSRAGRKRNPSGRPGAANRQPGWPVSG